MSKLTSALARCRHVPFDRDALEGMEADQVRTVAKGALKRLPSDSDDFRRILTARIDETEDRIGGLAGFARNHDGGGGEIDFPVRNVLSGPRGSAVLDRDRERERFEGRARDGDTAGVDVRNVLSGPRGEGVLDE